MGQQKIEQLGNGIVRITDANGNVSIIQQGGPVGDATGLLSGLLGVQKQMMQNIKEVFPEESKREENLINSFVSKEAISQLDECIVKLKEAVELSEKLNSLLSKQNPE